MPTTDPRASPNEFESGKPGTAARSHAESTIENLRRRGGVFVDAVRATRMAMVMTDPSLPGNPIVFANQSFLDLSGYAMDEVLGQQPYFMNGADTDPEDAESFRRALQEDRDVVVETVQYRKDGTRFVANVLLSAFKDADGDTLNHFLSWMDVTRRVNAEAEVVQQREAHQALRANEERLAADLEAMEELQRVSLELVGEHEPQALYERILNAAVLLMRSDAASIQRLMPGTQELRLLRQRGFHPKSAKIWDCVRLDTDSACARALRSYERIVFHDAEAVVKDRSDLEAYRLSGLRSVQTTPLRAHSGQVVGMLSTHWREPHTPTERDLQFFDILARLAADVLDRLQAGEELRKSEAALRESEGRLAAAFESVPAGLAAVDLSGRVIVSNAEYRRFLPNGIIPSRDADRGHRWKAWNDEGRPLAPEEFPGARALRGESVVPGQEMLHLDEDGREIWTNVATVPTFDQAGQIAGFVSVISDIDERKRAEAALRDSEERYRELFERIDEGFCIVEVIFDGEKPVDYRFLEVNPAFERHTGIANAQGRLMREIAPDHEQHWFDHYGKIALTGRPERFEAPAKALGDRWYDLNAFRVGEPDQRRVAIVFTDVTQRQRDTVALRENEERLRLIVESARDYAIFTIDADRAVTQWLPGAQSVFGWTKEEIEGRSADILFTPADREQGAPQNEVKTALREGKAPDIRWHMHKDGHCVFIEGQTVPLKEGGERGGFLKIGQDITVRRAAEEALRESEERLRQFGEASQDILWIRDAETLQWTYLTPAFETIYGRSREEALTGDNYRSWLDLILPEDQEKVTRSIERVRAGEQVAFDFRIRRPSDGRICWLRNTDFPIVDAAGKVVLIGGIGHDLTELRESGERARLLLAELQHRVRNIMAMIRSIARRTGETAETVDDYVQHLQGRISAMARTQVLLTRDVNAAAKLEDLILDELEMQAARPEQYAVTGTEVSLPPKAAEVLGLALHELATNAVKYGALSAKDGHIDVRWALLDGDNLPHLSLVWSESGVRIENQPSRSGFGTELVTERVPYELHGTGTMEFRPTGLVATIEFPLHDMPSILQTDDTTGRPL